MHNGMEMNQQKVPRWRHKVKTCWFCLGRVEQGRANGAQSWATDAESSAAKKLQKTQRLCEAQRQPVVCTTQSPPAAGGLWKKGGRAVTWTVRDSPWDGQPQEQLNHVAMQANTEEWGPHRPRSRWEHRVPLTPLAPTEGLNWHFSSSSIWMSETLLWDH